MSDKIWHRAKLINNSGEVLPLCQTINGKPKSQAKSTLAWTNRDEAVTCPFCLERMKNGGDTSLN